VGTAGTIGSQLKRLRGERGLSQAELAERAGVSPDLIAKLEQGIRQSARLTSLVKLARALDVGLPELLDRRPRMNRGPETGSLVSLRDVLLSTSDLPGLDHGNDGGEPTPREDLDAALRSGWNSYWSGRFGRLASALPALIEEARVSHRAAGPSAAGPLAQSYQLAAYLMVHMGKDDIALVGTERAINAAASGSDELQWATLNGTYAWVLLQQGRLHEAESHAARVAAQIEPSLTRSSPEHLTVWGGLLLTALATAAAAGRGEEAGEYLSLARAGAVRLDSEAHHYAVSFGPTQVAMQAVHAYTVLGSPAKAFLAAKDVDKDQLLPVAYGRHLLDLAQAQLDARRDREAKDTLERARQVSPEWFRHQGVARSAVADLIERQSRLTPALQELARAADLR